MDDRRRILHPEDGMVFACPNCDAVPINRRKQGNTVIAKGHEYVCYECKTGFHEPRERERHDPATSRCAKNGLARKLESMDPDEVGV